MKRFTLSAKVFLTALSAGFVLYWSPSAFGGNGASGGGKGVVCRDASHKILSVELLDLWEAKNIFQRTVQISNEPLEAQIKSAISRMKYAIQTGFSEIEQYPDPTRIDEPLYLAQRMQVVAGLMLHNAPNVVRLRGARLPVTNDSEEPARPDDCEIEQIVTFMDSQTAPKILINQDLFERLDLTNQAALITHEALYAYLRGEDSTFFNYREPDSIRVRRAVGYVFAGSTFPSLRQQLGKSAIECSYESPDEASTSRLFFYQEQDHANVITSIAFGKPSIGLFPRTELSWNYITNPHKECLGKKGRVDAKFHFGLPGNGPVDFQSRNWIRVVCEDEKAVFYITPFETRGDTPSQLKLTCETFRPRSL